MKKLLTYVLLIAIIFLGCLNFAKADEIHLTMEQVVEKLNESLKNASELGLDNLSVKIEDNKLVFMEDEEKGLEFTIDGDVISDTLTVKNTDDDDDADLETFGNVLIRTLLYSDIINVVANLRGYSERDIRTFSVVGNASVADPTMDNDGYEVKTDQQETTTTLTFKIDINKFNLKVEYLDLEAPTLNLTDITSNSVTISAKSTDDTESKVEIYRSLDNENFEWIMSIGNSEGAEISMIDNELEPNTTYYYKAVLEKSKNFSDVVTIKTLSAKVLDNNEADNKEEENKPVIPSDADKPTDNKQTGGLNPIYLSLLIPGGLLGISFLNKKKMFNKI